MNLTNIKNLLVEKFGFSAAELSKMHLDNIYFLSKEAIDEKTEFYKSELNLNDSEFKKMVRDLPTLLSLNDDLIKAKKNFIRQNLS